jgi:hypothetical protein
VPIDIRNAEKIEGYYRDKPDEQGLNLPKCPSVDYRGELVISRAEGESDHLFALIDDGNYFVFCCTHPSAAARYVIFSLAPARQ